MRINNPDQFFSEFTESLLLVPHDIPIDVISLASAPDDVGDKRVYVYNTEQLTRSSEKERVVAIAKRYPVIDYSRANIFILSQEISPPIYHLPILYQPKFIFPQTPKHLSEAKVELASGHLVSAEPKTERAQRVKQHDVGLLFSPTPYRLQFVRDLVNNGISYHWINRDASVFDIDIKTPEILKCKIFLNVHADESYRVFEFSRCSIPVFNGQIVLSEECDHRDLETGTNALVQSYVHFAKRSNLIPRLKEMLANIAVYEYQPDLEQFERVARDDISRFVTEVSSDTSSRARHAPSTNDRASQDLSRFMKEVSLNATPKVPVATIFSVALYTPSDIGDHIATFRRYAKKCTRITEMGTRSTVSSWGFLKGLTENPCDTSVKKMVKIDLNNDPNITRVAKTAEAVGISYNFIQGDSAYVDLDETDLLFIDTWHVYGHLKRELAKHHSKVTKYIMMHDTSVDAIDGESIRVGWDTRDQALSSGYPEEEIRRGLMPAIEEFLVEHPEWKLHHRFTHNNGLTILKRVV